MSILSPRTLDETLEQITQVGAMVCQYCGDPARWLTVRCDCKYGASGRGEQTGCPELRDAYDHLSRMKGTPDLVSLESNLHAAHAAAAMADSNIGQVRRVLAKAIAASIPTNEGEKS